MLGTLARGVKDGALGLSFKAYLNDKFKEYGDVTDVAVDTQANRLTLKAMLRGEKDQVSATIERYDIEKSGSDYFIVLRQFSSSRAWLTLLLSQLFAGKRYKLPSAVSKLL
ncbi:MAG: hypothetical protein JWR16_2879 [Nevskia sp.]|nr:hypothetical protein [Nevskia sp.]